ncbi:DUF4041 domain-containing protein [bacterium]|nr:DUF4041 domain-containing protein [bacterium]
MPTLVAILLFILVILLTYMFLSKSKQYKILQNRFKDVIDIDEEKAKVEKQLAAKKKELAKLESDFKKSFETLSADYKSKRAIYEKLLKEISILEEDLDFISYGVYKPHFDFDTSEKYKEKITEIRQQQKALMKNKTAAICHMEWQVSGSKREGRKMTNRNIKLMLRAFNNECDAATLKVKWNNVEKMEQRIIKAFEAINKMGEPNRIDITRDYLNLKLKELYLAHEYKEKRQEEKEEQRRIREQIREKEKVQKEIEKAQKEAEDDEIRSKKALEQARKEIEKATGEKLANLKDQISLLEQQLKEAQEKKERAISRAQMTKSGNVYVISNIGSFGKDVYKIGMTRRLEPLDRVRELGDASVPFRFDVHAMIFSENAPELENKLHQIFDDKRLNLVNKRKEFFHVTLDEIEKIVKENHGEIEFTKIAEAREYRETLSIIEQNEKKDEIKEKLEKEFPEEL